MSDSTMRLLITGAFAMHGLGMAGAAAYLPWAIRSKGFIEGSWLLDAVAYPWLTIVVGMVVWGAAGVGFLGAAWGYWQGASWWTAWAWIGAVTTLAAIALFFGKVVPGVYVGGVLAVAVLYFLIRGV